MAITKGVVALDMMDPQPGDNIGISDEEAASGDNIALDAAQDGGNSYGHRRQGIEQNYSLASPTQIVHFVTLHYLAAAQYETAATI